MCGIYGFIGKPTNKTRTIIKNLGILNVERGADSSGIGIFSDSQYYHYKKAVDSQLFFEVIQPEKYIYTSGFNNFVNIIGHTRHATTGSVNDNNSHPFLFDNVFFAHNGIISNFDTLQKKYNTHYAVDSQIIGHLLQEKNNDIDAFSELRGWLTVPYIHLEDIRSLYIATYNAPLHFAISNNGVYYSSQKNHLQKALQKSKVSASIGQGGTNKLYKFTYNNETITIQKSKIQVKSSYEWGSYTGYQSNFDYYSSFFKTKPRKNQQELAKTIYYYRPIVI